VQGVLFKRYTGLAQLFTTNKNKDSMENSKLLTILVEVDEGTKTPFKAHNEILSLFSVVVPKGTCCEPVGEGFYLGTSCPKCKKPFRQNLK